MTVAGYLVRREPDGSYLERVPYDGAFRFLAGCATPEYATVFSRRVADLFAAHYRSQGAEIRVLAAPGRTVQIDVADLAPAQRAALHRGAA